MGNSPTIQGCILTEAETLVDSWTCAEVLELERVFSKVAATDRINALF